MNITFDTNTDDLTEVIKTVKFLQNYKLETVDTEQEESPAPVTDAEVEKSKKRGRRSKAEIEADNAAASVVSVVPVEPQYTAQQFYQTIVDLNKAGRFNPNTDMAQFCRDVSIFAGKEVKNIVEITAESSLIQAAFQVLKNHGLL